MKIDVNNVCSRVPFGSLPQGGTFIYDNIHYMKIQPVVVGDKYNAVALDKGGLSLWTDEFEVIKTGLKIVKDE